MSELLWAYAEVIFWLVTTLIVMGISFALGYKEGYRDGSRW